MKRLWACGSAVQLSKWILSNINKQTNNTPKLSMSKMAIDCMIDKSINLILLISKKKERNTEEISTKMMIGMKNTNIK